MWLASVHISRLIWLLLEGLLGFSCQVTQLSLMEPGLYQQLIETPLSSSNLHL